MDKQRRIWELLGKKSAAEASDQELQELAGLLQCAGEDVHYMMSVMEHFWHTVQNAPESEAMRSLGEPLPLPDMAGEKTAGNRIVRMKRFKSVFWIAAAVSAFILGAWFVYAGLVKPVSEVNVVTTKNGSKTKVTLPDGTQVWLNGGSKLTYPNDFRHISSREVTLSGEAYFEVKHDAAHPFVIHTEYLDIKDVGTIFNVKAYPNGNMDEATLISGAIEVSVRSNPSRTLMLRPREKVSYYAKNKMLSLEGNGKTKTKDIAPLSQEPDKLEITKIQPLVEATGDTIITETAWTRNQLVFQSESFSALAKQLERWYNVDITIKNEKIKQYVFTGIFEGETLEQALKELQMIRSFHFSIVKDRVNITP